MVLWARWARAEQHYQKSNFKSAIENIIQFSNNCRSNFRSRASEEPDSTLQNRLAIEMRSKGNNQSMNLLWFFIHPEAYFPQIGTSMLKWRIPTHLLEFDHRGVFKQLSSNHYYYEGGESKGTYSVLNRIILCLIFLICAS